MEIQELRVLRGPNYWSLRHKVILLRLDIGKFENLPSNKLIGFNDRLIALMPGLSDHHCSEGRPGGFIERLKSGTWIGHVVEHIALELQTLAGMSCNYGKTRSAGEKAIYYIAISFLEERAGIYAAETAVRIADSLAAGTDYKLEPDLENLRRIAAIDMPGPSTASILKAAAMRGIPYFKMNDAPLFQLGYGIHSKRIDATLTENTSNIAVDIACDKQRTKELLIQAGIPVPQGYVVKDRSEAVKVLEKIGFPVVIKPVDGNHGKGVAINVINLDDAMLFYDETQKISKKVIIEKYHKGNDYRLLVINYKLEAAALRTPATVTGDDHSSVRELVEITNRHPARGIDHENILTQLKIDYSTESLLKMQR